MSLSLTVAGAGLVTAVGYNAAASLAALRAGISGVQTQAWIDRQSGKPFRCARVVLPQRWEGAEFLADLVAPAIDECLRVAKGDDAGSVPLLIAVSEPSRPGRPPAIERNLLEALSARFESRLHPESKTYPTGQTGCLHALLEAARLIRERRTTSAIVAGVDSFVNRITIEAYAQRRRILTPANINGFLPGEAGAAVLVTSLPAPFGGVRVTGWGQATEAATIEGTRPFRAEGMTLAVRTALESCGLVMGQIGFRITDLSGEHYKFKEAAFVAQRLDRSRRPESLPLWHPIEYLGEIGAAIGPCLIAWASHAMRAGYAPGANALGHVSADGGERAAFVIQAFEPTARLQ
jgi:3-oxoacyl-[acyl-carrier-protein] synthase-1